MDVDTIQKCSLLPSTCYCCRELGHFSRNCRKPVDIGTLTVDELQEILEDRLAQLDVTPDNLDPPAAALPKSVEEQDFLKNDE
jgi:hypothetical protein